MSVQLWGGPCDGEARDFDAAVGASVELRSDGKRHYYERISSMRFEYRGLYTPEFPGHWKPSDDGEGAE